MKIWNYWEIELVIIALVIGMIIANFLNIIDLEQRLEKLEKKRLFSYLKK